MLLKGRSGMRAAFLSLLVASTGLAAATFLDVLKIDGLTGSEGILLALYTALVAWIGASFWISAFGAADVLMSRRRSTSFDSAFASPHGVSDGPRIALVMPLHNEDAGRALDGLRATYESLAECGAIQCFHFFVLSDSGDAAACRKEEAAWVALCRDLEAGGRLFYRRRRENVGKKAGNIKEFCERWGRCYDYMIVLDADSVMAGRTILDMVQRMDREPALGLLQAWPVPVNGVTLFARAQQFAAAAYGRLIAAGLSRLMEEHATYWGHNAIIRTSAFMQSCGLPRLSGREPLGGEILSHDFVEAALLVRHGWRVRIMVDGEGSYEEGPPNLLEHAKRDRRWCQGNLQHTRMLFAEGFKAPNRLNFLLGIFSYCASPLWLAFIVTAVVIAARPVPLGAEALDAWLATLRDMHLSGGLPWLIGLTAVLLVGPKVLGMAVVAFEPARRRAFGGTLRLVVSGALEMLFTALIAPAMMLLHTEFVASILAGRSVKWNAQSRDGEDLPTIDAVRILVPRCALGIVLAGFACWWAPGLVWWMAPLLAGFALAVPLTLWSSRESIGRTARGIGVFLVPSETAPHPVIARLAELRSRASRGEQGLAPLVAEMRTLLRHEGWKRRETPV
jgi:membrane glycosyltransferase